MSTDTIGVSAARLKAFIDRIEKLEDDKTAIGEDLKEIYSEAKGTGFDVKTIRSIVRLRKVDVEKRRGLGLTPTEGRVLGILMKRDIAKKEAIMLALYDGRVSDKDVPDIKIVDVFVCKMRAKLKRHGVIIETCWGVGYGLQAASKDAVRSMLGRREFA